MSLWFQRVASLRTIAIDETCSVRSTLVGTEIMGMIYKAAAQDSDHDSKVGDDNGRNFLFSLSSAEAICYVEHLKAFIKQNIVEASDI